MAMFQIEIGLSQLCLHPTHKHVFLLDLVLFSILSFLSLFILAALLDTPFSTSNQRLETRLLYSLMRSSRNSHTMLSMILVFDVSTYNVLLLV